MKIRNELVPRDGGRDDGAPRDGASEDGDARDRYAPRLKSPEEISSALDQLAAMVAVGLMPAAQARVLTQIFKTQLDCTRAGTGESGAAAADSEVGAAAAYFEANPAALGTLASLLGPEALQAILLRLRGGR